MWRWHVNKCTFAAAYTGLQVDIDRIRADNAARTDVDRKSGLIIWSGRKNAVLLLLLLHELYANFHHQHDACSKPKQEDEGRMEKGSSKQVSRQSMTLTVSLMLHTNGTCSTYSCSPALSMVAAMLCDAQPAQLAATGLGLQRKS